MEQHVFRAHVTEAPDASEVPARVSAMPNGSEIVQKALEHAGERAEAAAETFTKEGLISNFRRARKEWSSGTYAKGHQYVISTTDSTVTKPRGMKKTPEKCGPILIKDLVLGATHRDRVLCGRVAIDDAYHTFSSSVLLLEDIQGDLVEVAIYNIPHATLSKVSRLFPRGRAIAIIEPFFKVRQDMTRGVRVDDPNEIVDWSYPVSCKDWRLLGNRFMRSTPCDPNSAALCYSSALNRSDTAFLQAKKDIAILLNNISLCDFRDGNWHLSVWYAGAATRLDPSNEKAWFRLIATLLELAKAHDAGSEAAAFAAIEIISVVDGRFDELDRTEWRLLRRQIKSLQAPTLGSPKLGGEGSWWHRARSNRV